MLFKPHLLALTKLDSSFEYKFEEETNTSSILLSQIRYLLVVILELNGVLVVQYKDVMMISINKNN